MNLRLRAAAIAGAMLVAMGGLGAAVEHPELASSLLERQAETDAELQAQLDLQLELVPGGQQVGRNEVSYEGGRFVVTFALPDQSTRGEADCPVNWFCLYANRDFVYPRGRLRDCGWHDLGRWGWHDRTESVHNHTSSDVDYINHEDFGNAANGHRFDEPLFTNRSGAAVDSIRTDPNRADHVERHC